MSHCGAAAYLARAVFLAAAFGVVPAAALAARAVGDGSDVLLTAALALLFTAGWLRAAGAATSAGAGAAVAAACAARLAWARAWFCSRMKLFTAG